MNNRREIHRLNYDAQRTLAALLLAGTAVTCSPVGTLLILNGSQSGTSAAIVAATVMTVIGLLIGLMAFLVGFYQQKVVFDFDGRKVVKQRDWLGLFGSTLEIEFSEIQGFTIFKRSGDRRNENSICFASFLDKDSRVYHFQLLKGDDAIKQLIRNLSARTGIKHSF